MKITPKSTFDECFQTFPRLRSPSKLTEFWQNALLELKKTPVDPRQKLLLKKSIGWDSTMDVNFQSSGAYRIRGTLSVPRKRGKVPAVISFHDCYGDPAPMKGLSEHGVAHLAIGLRGHEPDARPAPVDGQEAPALALFREYGLDKVEASYPYACFLDAIRCIDFIRLQKGIDSSRLAVLGRGFGAAMAIFATALRGKDIRALALERVGFTWMEGWLQESGSRYADEIRLMMAKNQSTRTRIRKNLDFLDPLNWAEIIKQPILVSSRLKDVRNTPRSGFAFFNHLKTEKDMQIFPDEHNDPKGIEERKRSVDFLAEQLQ